MKIEISNELRIKILELHRENSVNHIVFLLDYKVGIDVVNQVLRDEIVRLSRYERI